VARVTQSLNETGGGGELAAVGVGVGQFKLPGAEGWNFRLPAQGAGLLLRVQLLKKGLSET